MKRTISMDAWSLVWMMAALLMLGGTIGFLATYHDLYTEFRRDSENTELALEELKYEVSYYRAVMNRYENALDEYEKVVTDYERNMERELELNVEQYLEYLAKDASRSALVPKSPAPPMWNSANRLESRWVVGFTNDLSGERMNTAWKHVPWPDNDLTVRLSEPYSRPWDSPLY